AQAQLKHLKVSVHEKETSLKFAHQQIAKYEKQRSEAGAKKEYDALQHEIDHCRQTGNVLEDEILTLMAQVEEKSAQVPELEKALAAVKAESAGFDMEARDRIARLTADLQATTANLVEVEKNIPGEVRSLYDRLTAAKGADAISAVQDQTCTACYSTVTAQQGRELEAGIVVLCKNCGRIMYLVK
ncbi:MAG: zinc ribbon domain-containing protein, partial [Gemmataceae bacterium]